MSTKKDDTLGSVIEYLSQNRDYSTELTAKKVMDRGKLLPSESGSGIVIFEVERHSAILGAQYTPGCPMSAYVTRWIRYSFDGSNIQDLGDNRDPVVNFATIDYVGLAADHVQDMSFCFGQDESGNCTISEVQNKGEEKLISSKEEVAAYAREIVSGWDLSYLKYTMEGYCSDEEMREILQKLTNAVSDAAVEKALDSAEDEGVFN